MPAITVTATEDEHGLMSYATGDGRELRYLPHGGDKLRPGHYAALVRTLRPGDWWQATGSVVVRARGDRRLSVYLLG